MKLISTEEKIELLTNLLADPDDWIGERGGYPQAKLPFVLAQLKLSAFVFIPLKQFFSDWFWGTHTSVNGGTFNLSNG